MQNKRRKFMMASGLAATGFALSGLQVLAAVDPAASAETEVSKVVSQYGKASKITRGERVEIRVELHSNERFAKTFNVHDKLPFERIMIGEGNTMSFTHRGVDFTIINVAKSY